MKARRLDRLVQIERAAQVDDGFSVTEVFASHGEAFWSMKTDVSDGERARAGIVEASLMTRFKVRWNEFSADLTPADRLVCEGVTYNVTGIKEVDGRRQWLEISATARSA